MVTMNGSLDHLEDAPNSATHLGKRKRSESPQKTINGASLPEFQQKLQVAFDKIERDEPIASLLHHALPPQSADRPDIKRVRLSSDEDASATISSKIQSGSYTSLNQLEDDIRRVKDAVFNTGERMNGDNKHDPEQDSATQLLALLSTHINSSSKSPLAPSHLIGQIITLRSQTEKGTQQLYSGLQVARENDKSLAIDGRRLPNGFDLADPATMDSALLAPKKDIRLFGDVFRPRPTLKQLEQPRPRQANRMTTLKFGIDSSLEKSTPINRSDYKQQSLPTSTWLSYSKGTSSNEPDAIRKQRERALTATDFRAVLAGSEVVGNEDEDADALFKKVFSSFTPSYDSSKGLINEEHQHRSYWRRHGRKRLNKIFKTEYPDLESEVANVAGNKTTEDDFADMVANFTPIDDGEDSVMNKDEPGNVEDVLEEVSQLLETVHSYQTIRAASNRNTEVSGDEFDTYELLRSQLSILVSSLPPFAIAKLDGEKLNGLNITTNIMVEGADYRGTGQPDDLTLQKYRAAQQATSAATRAPQQQPARNQYPTPATTQRYGSTYGQAAPQPAFNPRPATNYQPPATAPRPYQPNTYNPQKAVQQFQRPPAQTGYNYNAQTTPGFTQTPSQPGYQQRAQQVAHGYDRTASPIKPLVNGGPPYYGAAEYAAQYQRPQQPYSPAQQTTPNQQPSTTA